MTLTKFIGIGISHTRQVFQRIYDILKEESLDAVTIEQRINTYTSWHELLSRKDLVLIRLEGEGELVGAYEAGILYALENGIPLFFVDGSHKEGNYNGDLEASTSINLTQATIEEKLLEHLIVYNGNIVVPNAFYVKNENGQVHHVNPTSSDMQIMPRNIFTSDAINSLGRKFGFHSLAHIGGIGHFEAVGIRLQSPEFIPLQDLVEAGIKGYHNVG
ncbi:MAG: hypothetical protein AABX78_00005 [Nanoarchaeota archaeon]